MRRGSVETQAMRRLRSPGAVQHERQRSDAPLTRGPGLLQSTGVPGQQRNIACCAAPGTRRHLSHLRILHQSTYQTALPSLFELRRNKHSSAARIVWSAPGAPSSHSVSAFALAGFGATSRRSRIKTEGARDAVGSTGPTGLDASRHRGLSKSCSAASPPVPWRPARGVYRFAPHRPRWTYPFRPPPLRQDTYPPLIGPKRCPALLTVPAAAASGARVTRGRRAGTMRLGPPDQGKPAPHLRRPRTGHRSPPRVWRLQTPRHSGRDGWDYIHGIKAVKRNV